MGRTPKWVRNLDRHACVGLLLLLGTGLFLNRWTRAAGAGGYHLVAWSELGMKEIESDYGIYAVEPPQSDLRAQLVDAEGRLVTVPGSLTITYVAVADASGSVNASSVGKSNFWDHAQALFGASPAPDTSLTGGTMPGPGNVPQSMTFDVASKTFVASGIPITPRDDSGAWNPYPLMRLVARDAGGTEMASTEVDLPVSDELDCALCHTSNALPAAMPPGGWVNDPDPGRDYRLNVLRLHDRESGDPRYTASLAAAGYNPAGLYETVVTDGQPVLCAACHASDRLAYSGYTGVGSLSKDMHYRHATAANPQTGQSLNASTDRSACYTCHPGAETHALRGVMGRSVGPEGHLQIQCQSCHGRMRDLGSDARDPWLDLPNCQSCHTGDAVHNNGAIRYTSAFDDTGAQREAVSDLFATNPDTPSPGYTSYRGSTEHGGLYCAACHGSAHAEVASKEANDNVQSLLLQGHPGTLADCESCHNVPLNTVDGGPHGLHPMDQNWVRRHANAAERNPEQCQVCHGTDYRGTELSRMLGDRTFNVYNRDMTFWKGSQIGCYNCHDGPRRESHTSNRAPTVVDASASTLLGNAVALDLAASDPDGDPLTLRIVSQPDHGTVGLSGSRATYFPESTYVGDATFTFAAWDGSTDSNLGVGKVTVIGPTVTPGPSPTPSPTATLGPSATPTATATQGPSPSPSAPGFTIYLPAAVTVS